MGSKEYGQYCPMALALERLGERWTLLIVRDLLSGPRRYSDLQISLPGIGTNILASRLKGLVEMGLVEKRELPPPAASTVYELTPTGHGLGPILLELGKWGMQFLRDQEFEPEQFVESMRSRYILVLDRQPRGDYTIELVVDGNPASVRLGPNRYEVEPGPAEDPDARVEAAGETFVELFALGRSVDDAVADDALTYEGDLEALRELVRCISMVGDAVDRGVRPAEAPTAS
jgi:DNA-binding HxlR family transcriptional regulator